jgi:hypothetical protein
MDWKTQIMEWCEAERIKEELKTVYAKLTDTKVFGEVAGYYDSIRDIGVTVIAVNGKYKNLLFNKSISSEVSREELTNEDEG